MGIPQSAGINRLIKFFSGQSLKNNFLSLKYPQCYFLEFISSNKIVKIALAALKHILQTLSTVSELIRGTVN